MEYTVKNSAGEVVDTATERPRARLSAILKSEATGETFTVYTPDGEFDSEHSPKTAAEADRIARGIGQVERNMKAGAKYER